MPRKSVRKHYHLSLKKTSFKLSAKTIAGLKLGLRFILFFLILFLLKNAYFSITKSVWDGKSQLTLAYEQNNKIGIIEVDPTLHEAVILQFPDDSYFPLALGFETYRADKIKALATQENLPLGKLLTKSMTLSLGILTQGYLVDLKDNQISLSNFIWQSLIHRDKSNLTAWDKLRLGILNFNLKINEIQIIKAEDEFLKVTKLPDGSAGYEIDDDLLTEFVLKQLSNPEFLQDKITWEIYNATDYDGLADSMRRIAANSGFDVTGIRQALDKREISTLYVSDWNKVNNNVRRFADFFHFPIVADNNYTQRSDIALYLGDDFWQEYFTNEN